jgi:hypothetical protein
MDQDDRRQVLKLVNEHFNLAQRLDEHLTRYSQDQRTAAADAVRQVMAEVAQQASAYTNLLLVAGYAGIFGVWQIAGDSLPHVWRAVAAALLVLSILLFTSHEFLRMTRQARFQDELLKALESRRPEDWLIGWKAMNAKWRLAEHTLWRRLVIAAAWCAFMAGAVLMVNLVADVVTSVGR